MEQSQTLEMSQSQVDQLRLEKQQLLDKFGPIRTVLDTVDRDEQQRILDQFERMNDPCSICYEVITDRASPDICNHQFCFKCISSAAK